MNELEGFQKKIKQIQSRIIQWFLNDSPRQFLWRQFVFSKKQIVRINDRLIDRRYAIFIAEFMLIRTKAEQVDNIYKEFLKTFPSFKHILHAKQDEIEGFLGGLGLKRRIIQLIEIAKKFKNEALPETFGDLEHIPGIGYYSASAYSCFANNQRVPLIDSNFIRIYCRLFGIMEKSEIRRNRVFIEFCGNVLPHNHYQEYNLGFLDLGALICTPVPKCFLCPIKNFCQCHKFLRLLEREVSSIIIPFFDQSGMKGILSRIIRLFETNNELRAIIQTHSFNRQAQKRISKSLAKAKILYPSRFISGEKNDANQKLVPGVLLQDGSLYCYTNKKPDSMKTRYWELVTDDKLKRNWINTFHSCLIK